MDYSNKETKELLDLHDKNFNEIARRLIDKPSILYKLVYLLEIERELQKREGV